MRTILLLALAAVSASAGNSRISNCLKERPARELVKTGFAQMFPQHISEIEGAPAGRFFKDTVTFTLPGVDNQGHFLDVRCLESGGFQRTCSAQRDVLEERVFFLTVLKSLPCDFSGRTLYMENNWEITPIGESVVKEFKVSYPRLWKEILGLMANSLARKTPVRSGLVTDE